MTSVLTPPPQADRSDVTLATKAVAVLACVAVGLRIDLFKGVTPGVVVVVLLAPVWWPQLRASWIVRALVGLTVLSLVAGVVLAWLVKDQRPVDARLATGVAGSITLAFVGVVVLLWARTLISVSAVVASLVAGTVLFAFTTPGLWADDPWKFAFARPVAILALLAVAAAATRAGRPRPGLAVVVMLALAAFGAASDSRSEAGFLVLTALLTTWQAVAIGTRRRLRAASPVLLIVTLAVAVYVVATQLFVSGALGADIQERSAAQIEASGSLLLGGRPEWSATVQLMADRPGGFGLGVLADSFDVQLAENGFASINVDPATGFEAYISNYMMANGFHLHSTAADLWASTGPVGIGLALLTLVIVAWGLSASLAVGRADPVTTYTAIIVVWDLAFSPLQSSLTEILFGLFLAIVSLEHARAARAAAADRPGGSRPELVVPGRRVAVPYGASASSPDRNGGIRGSR